MRLLWIVATVLTLAGCGDPDQRQYNVALHHMSAGNYDAAIPTLASLAKNGFSAAQFRLGFLQFNGIGMPRNAKSAMQWFEKAAQQGDVGGQYSLALIYLKGAKPFGVEPNHALSRRWFEQLAERDFAPAQFELGILYEQGKGGEPDDAMAVKWFKRAADRHYKKAIRLMVEAYSKGLFGLPQDPAMASYWHAKTGRKAF